MPDNSTTSFALCTECGLCCSGAIFNSAKLDSDEIEPAKTLGLAVYEGERPGFRLPCARLAGTLCGIYEQRPRACARYYCHVIEELADGTIDAEEARERVQTARQLKTNADAAVDAELPGAQRQVAETALQLYLDKFFRRAKDAPRLVHESIGPNDRPR